jgi:hypothetical protein
VMSQREANIGIAVIGLLGLIFATMPAWLS